MTVARKKTSVRPERSEAKSKDGPSTSALRAYAQGGRAPGHVVLRTLRELCEKSITTVDPKRNPEREFHYIDISAVNNSTKRIVTPQLVRGKSASVRARQLVRTNDVLVSTTRPNLNAVALVPEHLDSQICSTGFCVLRCGAELDPNYLFCFVQSQRFVGALAELVQGALYPAVTDKQVFAQVIPWVSLDAQRRTATRLKTQLAAIETARQAAQAQAMDVDALLQATYRSAFRGVTDGANFTPIGLLARTASGTTPSRSRKEYWEPPAHPWVKTGEVVFAPIRSTAEKISERALKECSLSLLPVGTVLIAMYGQGKTRGQSAVLEVPATTNQACFAILPCDSLDPEYLQFWLRHSYEMLREASESRGGNQPNLNGEILSQFEVPVIPLEQQRALVARIKEAETTAGKLQLAAQAQLADLEALPARLLAQAFDFSDEGASS